LLGAVIIGFLLFIRSQDLPKPEPVSPFKHLDERKATIYESLRDLQFEYRVNKLSDEDYQTTKVELQKELARVLAEVDRIKSELAAGGASVGGTAVAAPVVRAPAVRNVCPSCGAKFEKALKFCGECGKPMGVSA
jgi:rRNA maturation endonuclease Nob1